MKIIVSTGSPGLDLEHIQDLLFASGLSLPVQPENQASSIEDWHDNIWKSHGIGHQTRTVHPDKSFEKQALDILHANQEKQVWGWTNPLSTWLLDFLLELDPNIYFLLVYSAPEEEIARFLLATEEATVTVETAMDLWIAYNTQLLRFYNRNRSRSVLMESSIGRTDPSRLITACNYKFDLSLNGDLSGVKTEETELDAIGIVLAKNYTQKRGDLCNLYNEIEATATLAGNNESLILADSAWSDYRRLRQTIRKQSEAYSLLAGSNHEMQSRVDQFEKEIETLGHEKKQLKTLQANVLQPEVKNEEKLLQQENELLLLQLHQAQEELEHYFLLYQEKQPTQDSDKIIGESDCRLRLQMDQYFSGDNWYSAESADEGTLRWSGPESRATILLPFKQDGEQLLVVHYRQVVVKDQLKGMRIEVDGTLVEYKIHDKLDQHYIIVSLPGNTEKSHEQMELAIKLPRMVKPCDIDPNSNDKRPLGIAIYNVSVIPVKPQLHFTWSESLVNLLKLRWKMYMKGLSINAFPLAYFDGVAYMEKYPDVADAVREGSVCSALTHYLNSGHKKGYAFVLADTQWPSEGNECDLKRMENS